jgi:anti-anti-sigma regulatory factor
MAVSRVSARAVSSASPGVGCLPLIEVRIEETPTEVVVRVSGQAGVRQAGELTAALLSPSARRPSLLTLDLSGLTCVSSLALGALTAFQRGLVRAGSRVRLAPVLQGPVRAALAQAELLPLFGFP